MHSGMAYTGEATEITLTIRVECGRCHAQSNLSYQRSNGVATNDRALQYLTYQLRT